MKYYVTIDGETREVALTPEGVRLGGEVLAAELATVPGTGLRHLRTGCRGHRLTARRVEAGWEVRIDGRAYLARVEDERTRSIRELAGGDARGSGTRKLRAPMPGKIVRVEVEPGQEVGAGDGLVVMEAMKMENELSADRPGTVSAVHIEAGETVQQNDVLITLE